MMYIISCRGDRLGFTPCAFPTLNFYEAACSWCDKSEMAWCPLTMDLKPNVLEKKKKTENWNHRALFQTRVCAYRVASPRDFSAISAQRKSMCPWSVRGKTMHATTDVCVLYKAGHVRRATAGNSRRLNSRCASWCCYCGFTLKRHSGIIGSWMEGWRGGGAQGVWGPVSSSSWFCWCVSWFASVYEIHVIQVQDKFPLAASLWPDWPSTSPFFFFLDCSYSFSLTK